MQSLSITWVFLFLLFFQHLSDFRDHVPAGIYRNTCYMHQNCAKIYVMTVYDCSCFHHVWCLMHFSQWHLSRLTPDQPVSCSSPAPPPPALFLLSLISLQAYFSPLLTAPLYHLLPHFIFAFFPLKPHLLAGPNGGLPGWV